MVIDEFTRECLALKAARRFNSDEAIHTLIDLFCSKGRPEYVRSDNGAEFSAKAVRSWLGEPEVAPLYIERGSPWENAYVESFNHPTCTCGTVIRGGTNIGGRSSAHTFSFSPHPLI